jgi:hypothetical protein
MTRMAAARLHAHQTLLLALLVLRLLVMLLHAAPLPQCEQVAAQLQRPPLHPLHTLRPVVQQPLRGLRPRHPSAYRGCCRRSALLPWPRRQMAAL